MFSKFVVIGGGIAGVTCAETLSALCPEDDIILITASALIKTVVNYQKVSRTLEQFDVEERHMSTLTCSNVKVIHKTVSSLDTDKHMITTDDGSMIQYGLLCLCNGGKPKIIHKDNPYVLGIRDTESVKEFQKRLRKARRIVVVGNGGIATELVYEIEGCEVIWAIKDKCISSTFIDPGAATFFLPHLADDKTHTDKPSKRLKYTEEVPVPCSQDIQHHVTGSALGPDWSSTLQMEGADKESRHVHVEYKVEVSRLLTPGELHMEGKTETHQPNLAQHTGVTWPVYVELTNNTVYGCDFIVSATGVEPNTQILQDCHFTIAGDGGVAVNNKMQTSIADVFAAGDICNASWEHAAHWTQMRLWSQARQMGAYAAKCMVAQHSHEDIHMDFCFEIFAHATKFFNYKVILLGKFNAQGLENDHELLLRVTKGKEYVKAVLHNGRLQGAILIGDTDLEETFENLILNETDLTPFKDHMLDSEIDIEDFFD